MLEDKLLVLADVTDQQGVTAKFIFCEDTGKYCFVATGTALKVDQFTKLIAAVEKHVICGLYDSEAYVLCTSMVDTKFYMNVWRITGRSPRSTLRQIFHRAVR